MKLEWSNKVGLLIGLVLIAITNAIALGGVAYNRSGEPESALELTERELPIVNWSWPDNENSSIDLRLDWRVRQIYSLQGDYGSWADDWLSQEQLRSLGFDVSALNEMDDAGDRRDQSKAVFLALEYDGPAYREAVEQRRERLKQATERAAKDPSTFEEQLKSAREALTVEEEDASRLFVVDASLDRDLLRSRYPDRTHYSIVSGRLRTFVTNSRDKQRIAALPELDIEQIRVPHAYRMLIEPLRERRSYSFVKRAPRFNAMVKFGRRLEPWIVQMEKI